MLDDKQIEIILGVGPFVEPQTHQAAMVMNPARFRPQGSTGAEAGLGLAQLAGVLMAQREQMLGAKVIGGPPRGLGEQRLCSLELTTRSQSAGGPVSILTAFVGLLRIRASEQLGGAALVPHEPSQFGFVEPERTRHGVSAAAALSQDVEFVGGRKTRLNQHPLDRQGAEAKLGVRQGRTNRFLRTPILQESIRPQLLRLRERVE